jgi:hypothetical protein
MEIDIVDRPFGQDGSTRHPRAPAEKVGKIQPHEPLVRGRDSQEFRLPCVGGDVGFQGHLDVGMLEGFKLFRDDWELVGRRPEVGADAIEEQVLGAGCRGHYSVEEMLNGGGELCGREILFWH